MERVGFCMLMEVCMKGHGKMGDHLVKDFISLQKATNTMVTLLKMSSMVLGRKNGLMELNMKEAFRKGKKKAREN